MKRFLSAVLALVMVITGIPVTTFASTPQEASYCYDGTHDAITGDVIPAHLSDDPDDVLPHLPMSTNIIDETDEGKVYIPESVRTKTITSAYTSIDMDTNCVKYFSITYPTILAVVVEQTENSDNMYVRSGWRVDRLNMQVSEPTEDKHYLIDKCTSAKILECTNDNYLYNGKRKYRRNYYYLTKGNYRFCFENYLESGAPVTSGKTSDITCRLLAMDIDSAVKVVTSVEKETGNVTMNATNMAIDYNIQQRLIYGQYGKWNEFTGTDIADYNGYLLRGGEKYHDPSSFIEFYNSILIPENGHYTVEFIFKEDYRFGVYSITGEDFTAYHDFSIHDVIQSQPTTEDIDVVQVDDFSNEGIVSKKAEHIFQINENDTSYSYNQTFTVPMDGVCLFRFDTTDTFNTKADLDIFCYKGTNTMVTPEFELYYGTDQLSRKTNRFFEYLTPGTYTIKYKINRSDTNVPLRAKITPNIYFLATDRPFNITQTPREGTDFVKATFNSSVICPDAKVQYYVTLDDKAEGAYKSNPFPAYEIVELSDLEADPTGEVQVDLKDNQLLHLSNKHEVTVLQNGTYTVVAYYEYGGQYVNPEAPFIHPTWFIQKMKVDKCYQESTVKNNLIVNKLSNLKDISKKNTHDYTYTTNIVHPQDSTYYQFTITKKSVVVVSQDVSTGASTQVTVAKDANYRNVIKSWGNVKTSESSSSMESSESAVEASPYLNNALVLPAGTYYIKSMCTTDNTKSTTWVSAYDLESVPKATVVPSKDKKSATVSWKSTKVDSLDNREFNLSNCSVNDVASETDPFTNKTHLDVEDYFKTTSANYMSSNCYVSSTDSSVKVTHDGIYAIVCEFNLDHLCEGLKIYVSVPVTVSGLIYSEDIPDPEPEPEPGPEPEPEPTPETVTLTVNNVDTFAKLDPVPTSDFTFSDKVKTATCIFTLDAPSIVMIEHTVTPLTNICYDNISVANNGTVVLKDYYTSNSTEKFTRYNYLSCPEGTYTIKLLNYHPAKESIALRALAVDKAIDIITKKNEKTGAIDLSFDTSRLSNEVSNVWKLRAADNTADTRNVAYVSDYTKTMPIAKDDFYNTDSQYYLSTGNYYLLDHGVNEIFTDGNYVVGLDTICTYQNPKSVDFLHMTFPIKITGAEKIDPTADDYKDDEPEPEPVPVIVDKDTTNPVIDGIVNNGVYDRAVNFTVHDESSYLVTIDKAVARSPFVIKDEGNHSISVEDAEGNTTICNITIDLQAPEFSGAYDGQYFTKRSGITINASDAVKLSAVYMNGDKIKVPYSKKFKNGTYVFKAVDGVGHSTKMKIVIDDQKPTMNLKKLSDTNKAKKLYWYDHSVTFKASDDISGIDKIERIYPDGSAKAVNNNYLCSDVGVYGFRVTDKAGNVTTKYFGVDNMTPKIKGVVNGKTYKKAVTVKFKGGGTVKKFKINDKDITGKKSYKIKRGKKTKKYKVTLISKSNIRTKIWFKVKGKK